MTIAAMKDILKRAETWPEEDQEKLVALARVIESQHVPGMELTPEDWKIIDSRVVSARQGGIVSDEEVEAFFAKHRRA
jgi:hypothetical protein